MGFTVKNALKKVLPQLGGLQKTVAAKADAKAGLDLLKQLASNAFSQAQKAGPLGELKVARNLPSPLALVTELGQRFASVGDFLRRSGGLSGGRRTLGGKKVNVPSLRKRAGASAAKLSEVAEELADQSRGGGGDRQGAREELEQVAASLELFSNATALMDEAQRGVVRKLS